MMNLTNADKSEFLTVHLSRGVDIIVYSRGHYTCDIKDKSSGVRYRTNDNEIPKTIRSNPSCVVLYRKVSYQ